MSLQDLPPGSWQLMRDDGKGRVQKAERTGQVTHLWLTSPNGLIAYLPLTGTHAWTWDRNMESPTVSPSIWINRGQATDWHGWLRDGEFQEA